MLSQISSRVRLFHAHDCFGRSCRNHMTASVAAFRPEIDNVVGGLDDIEVVLDDEKAAAGIEQRAKGREQFVDIVKVQAGGRLVEDIERFRARAFREVRGELDALGFAAAKASWRIVPDADSPSRHHRARAGDS